MERAMKWTTDDLTPMELGFLELLLNYGDGLDLSGPRFNATIKAAARECERKGLISGKPKSYSITNSGKAVIRPNAA
jgi:hypothetical protein